MQTTKDQHFVPKMLLKHFISDTDNNLTFSKKGYLSVLNYDVVDTKLEYMKSGGFDWGAIIKYKKPTEVMKEDFIYELDTLPINTIENRYGNIETKVEPILRNFIKSIDVNANKLNILDADIEILIRFMFIQSARSKKALEQVDYLDKMFSNLFGNDVKTNIMLENSELYSNTVTSFYSKVLKNYSFVLYKVPKDYHFVIGESATMWMNNFTDLYMPISPIYCIALLKDNGRENLSIKDMLEKTYLDLLNGYLHNSNCLISDMFRKDLIPKIVMDRLLYTSKDKILSVVPIK